MRVLPPELKFMLVATIAGLAICAGLISAAVWGFRRAHELASFSLPEGHQIRLSIAYNLDVASDVRCRLSGPSVHHSRRYIGSIGASESRPAFTLHRVPNSQVFWVTSESLPLTVLYAVNLDTGEYWPGVDDGAAEALKGQQLLKMINSYENGHTLNNYARWIGVKKPNKRVETNRRPAFPFGAEQEFASASYAPPLLSAAVAHPRR